VADHAGEDPALASGGGHGVVFDMEMLEPLSRYRLLTSTIVPRPIAWVTTQDEAGGRNAAPFSCFNLMGYSPPLVALGLQSHPDGALKDSAANIISTGELVINLVREADAEAMVMTSIEGPSDLDETVLADLELAESVRVAPPRIASAPVSLECRVFQVVRPSALQTIVLAEVLAMHVASALVLDAERGHVDTPGLGLIGRMQGPGWYVRCGDLLQVGGPG